MSIHKNIEKKGTIIVVVVGRLPICVGVFVPVDVAVRVPFVDFVGLPDERGMDGGRLADNHKGNVPTLVPDSADVSVLGAQMLVRMLIRAPVRASHLVWRMDAPSNSWSVLVPLLGMCLTMASQ